MRWIPTWTTSPNVVRLLSLSREDAIIQVHVLFPAGLFILQDVPKAVERSSDIQSRRGLLQRVACPCVDETLIASYFDKTASLVFAVRVASVVNSRVNSGKGLSDAISCAVITSRVRKWLADTGCGHDLVDKDEIKGLTQLCLQLSGPVAALHRQWGNPC